ncbi:MAG: 2-C-methyl-D-erythritol 2,4-cyclodiphosphate synthase [Candidatus Heteroscillospira sp.]|jgi:2-C-methyl-D-erythritol 2,4-cyclodiphosphate synthase
MMRIGHGYDAHRLVPERELILGGAHIPFEQGLDGHSDADVLVHALMDALLGAAALGDIGKLFPPSDEQYRGISSLLLLKRVSDALTEQGWSLENADCTVIAQRPRMAAYIPEMRRNIAGVLGADISCISIKATTEEKMGFTGSGEGICAHAVVLIEK